MGDLARPAEDGRILMSTSRTRNCEPPVDQLLLPEIQWLTLPVEGVDCLKVDHGMHTQERWNAVSGEQRDLGEAIRGSRHVVIVVHDCLSGF